MTGNNWQLSDEIRDYWSDRAATFDDHAGHRISDGREARAWQNLFGGALGRQDLQGLRVLDLACGTGEISRMALDMGAHVTGVDFSEPMLQRARIKHAGRDWRGVQSDVQHLIQLSDASFDAAFARHLVWTLTEPQAAFAEWFRVLKPGGHLVITDGDWSGRLDLRGRVMRWIADRLARQPVDYARDPDRFEAIMRRLPYGDGLTLPRLKVHLEQAGFSAIRALPLRQIYGRGMMDLPLATRLRLSAPQRFGLVAIRG